MRLVDDGKVSKEGKRRKVNQEDLGADTTDKLSEPWLFDRSETFI